MSKEDGADMVTIELGGYEIQVSLNYTPETPDTDDEVGENEELVITGLSIAGYKFDGQDFGPTLKAILEDISGAIEHIETLCWEQRERNGGF